MGTLALIGLGSNLGDRKAHLNAAIAALGATPGVAVRAVSSYHETAPVGGPGGQDTFLNAAAALETTLGPEPLLDALNAIEARAGRVRTVRWGGRTLDLDLLLFGNRFIETPRLRVPHPRMAVRRFVLAPLAEIAHAAIDPMTGRTVAELLANLDRRPRYVILHGAESPSKTAIFRKVVAGLGAEGMQGEVVGSPEDAGPDPLTRRLNDLEARYRTLAPKAWPADRLGDRWLTTDFCLDLDEQEVRAAYLARQLRNGGRMNLELTCIADRLQSLASQVLRSVRPTFAVVLDPGPARQSFLKTVDFPLLWPDARDPEAVVLETLAACAATCPG